LEGTLERIQSLPGLVVPYQLRLPRALSSLALKEAEEELGGRR